MSMASSQVLTIDAYSLTHKTTGEPTLQIHFNDGSKKEQLVFFCHCWDDTIVFFSMGVVAHDCTVVPAQVSNSTTSSRRSKEYVGTYPPCGWQPGPIQTVFTTRDQWGSNWHASGNDWSHQACQAAQRSQCHGRHPISPQMVFLNHGCSGGKSELCIHLSQSWHFTAAWGQVPCLANFWHYIKCLGWPLRLPSLLCLEWHCNPCLLQFLLYCLPPHGIEPSMQIVVWLFGSTFGFHVITLIHNQMCPVVNNIIYSMNQSWTCREWCCPGVSSMVCAMKWHCNWPKWHFIVCVTHGNPQGLFVIGIGHCFSVWILAKVSIEHMKHFKNDMHYGFRSSHVIFWVWLYCFHVSFIQWVCYIVHAVGFMLVSSIWSWFSSLQLVAFDYWFDCWI